MDKKRISKKREKSIAKDIGGRASPGSGNQWFQKSDAYSEHFRVEDKFTDKLSYSIQYSTLAKIEKEAINTNRVPILRFGFLKSKDDYAVVRKIDCNEEYITDIYEVFNKSISFQSHELQFLFLGTKNIAICEINFKQYNKVYYIIKWFAFLDNKKKFIA